VIVDVSFQVVLRCPAVGDLQSGRQSLSFSPSRDALRPLERWTQDGASSTQLSRNVGSCIISTDVLTFHCSYNLMLECWHENPGQRPTFTDLKDDLDRILALTVAEVRTQHLGLS
jgi:hypothetical protein